MTKNSHREHERVTLDLDVRFISKEDLECVGRLINISEGGLAMVTSAKAKVGDEIIAYPEGLGRLTGTIVRKTDEGIAVQFNLSTAQKTYLKKRISSAVRGVPYIRMLENRSHKRIKLNMESKGKIFSTGDEFECVIVNLSESGALVQSNARPDIGEKIKIGALRGIVKRHTKNGFAMAFFTECDDSMLDFADAGSTNDDTFQTLEDNALQPQKKRSVL